MQNYSKHIQLLQKIKKSLSSVEDAKSFATKENIEKIKSDFKLEEKNIRFGLAKLINGSKGWGGFLLENINEHLNGSLVAMYDKNPLVISKYPRAKIIENLESEYIFSAQIQESYDGIMLEVFSFDGEEMIVKLGGDVFDDNNDINYGELLEQASQFENIKEMSLSNPGKLFSLMLYGNHKDVKKDIKYDIELGIVVLDAYDLENLTFLGFEKCRVITKKHNVEFGKSYNLWDNLTQCLNEMNNEGVVFKRYNAGDLELFKVYSKSKKELSESKGI